jgi:hypothetical protein
MRRHTRNQMHALTLRRDRCWVTAQTAWRYTDWSKAESQDVVGAHVLRGEGC